MDVMLGVLNTTEAGKYLGQPQAPICSVQLQGGHQNLWFNSVLSSSLSDEKSNSLAFFDGNPVFGLS